MSAGINAQEIVGLRGQRRVIDGISLSLQPGECVGLVGRSGVGKSTLLLMIAGIVPVAEGRLHVGGRPVSQTPPRDLGVHLLGQSPLVLDHMSVRQNLELPTRFRRGGDGEMTVEVVARQLALEPLLEQSARAISGGERQRIAIGQAMRSPASVLLLDEPVKAALEPELRHQVRSALTSHVLGRGKTVIFVSHDVEDIGALADRVLVLGSRSMLDTCSVEEFFTSPPTPQIARDMDLAVVVTGTYRAEAGGLVLAEGGDVVLLPAALACGEGIRVWVLPYSAWRVRPGGGWILDRTWPVVAGARARFAGSNGSAISLILRSDDCPLHVGQTYSLQVVPDCVRNFPETGS
jgi:ABC-type sugar transport system ATPase subunit